MFRCLFEDGMVIKIPSENLLPFRNFWYHQRSKLEPLHLDVSNEFRNVMQMWNNLKIECIITKCDPDIAHWLGTIYYIH